MKTNTLYAVVSDTTGEILSTSTDKEWMEEVFNGYVLNGMRNIRLARFGFLETMLHAPKN